MSDPWTVPTLVAAFAGGLLIGAAAALLLLGAGRIAGIAGIVGGPLRRLARGEWRQVDPTRLAFLAGLLAAPWVWRLAAPWPVITPDVGPAAIVVAGLCVGIGVRLANGCTSGHGVCGLARGSRRSLAAVPVFMACAMLTVYGLRHVT